MRETVSILALCSVLALGMTGCDDDPEPPPPTVAVEEQVMVVLPAVVSVAGGVSALGSVLTELSGSPQASANTAIAGEQSCPAGPQTCPVPLDPSPAAGLCDGGGTAEACDDPSAPIFLDVSLCQNDTAGVVLDGVPAAVEIGSFLYCLDLDIDAVTVVGTADYIDPQAGSTCFESSVELDVSGDTMIRTIFGNIIGCEDGTVSGTPIVLIPDLNVQMEFVLSAVTAEVVVNTLDAHEFIAHCSIQPTFDSEPECSFTPADDDAG